MDRHDIAKTSRVASWAAGAVFLVMAIFLAALSIFRNGEFCSALLAIGFAIFGWIHIHSNAVLQQRLKNGGPAKRFEKVLLYSLFLVGSATLIVGFWSFWAPR